MKLILERIYDLRKDEKVRLQIFDPYESTEGWRCKHVISWPEKPDAGFESHGVDKLDALLFSIKAAEIFLIARSEWSAGDLLWLESKDLGLHIDVEALPKI